MAFEKENHESNCMITIIVVSSAVMVIIVAFCLNNFFGGWDLNYF